jgi:hypothetical protein
LRPPSSVLAFLGALLVSGSAAAAACPPPKTMTSPDAREVARIAPANGQVSCDESQVEISEKGKVVAAKGFGSADGQNGYGVRTAIWTRDSRFFVFDMESSGGHQPLYSPLYVFDTQARTLAPLSMPDTLITSSFKIERNDRLAITVWDVSKQASRSIEVALKQAK